MGNWYECRVKYEKTLENGARTKVREDYVTKAESVADAELLLMMKIKETLGGEFDVDSVKKARIAEIFVDRVYQDADKWYKAKVVFVKLDEKSGEEKRKASTMLIKSRTVKDAVLTLESGMKGTMDDWELAAVTETTIVDVWEDNREK